MKETIEAARKKLKNSSRMNMLRNAPLNLGLANGLHPLFGHNKSEMMGSNGFNRKTNGSVDPPGYSQTIYHK